jgi:hypothetical protein
MIIKQIGMNKLGSTMLFSYTTTYKVATWYTPYQLVYGLHPLMPIGYIVLVIGGEHKDNTQVRVLTSGESL